VDVTNITLHNENADRAQRILDRLNKDEQLSALIMLQDMYGGIDDQQGAFAVWANSYERITGLTSWHERQPSASACVLE
jgi:hypothetical protein